MKRLVSVLGVLALAFLIAACGGGSSSTKEATVPAGEFLEEETGEQEHPGEEMGQQGGSAGKKKQKRERQAQKRQREREQAQRTRREEKKRNARKKRAQEKKEAAAQSAVDPITAEEFHHFRGTDLGNWEIAYGVCAVTPEKQLAREFHTEQNWAAIGHAYGQGYREPFNIAAEEGCMAALNDSPKQRQAAFALMEANE